MKKPGRKVYHLAGGLTLIALYVLLGRRAGLAALAFLFALVTAADLARLKLPTVNDFVFRHFHKFVRDNERARLTGTPWYVLGVLSAAALYTLPVAVYSVVFLACGDVAATAVGERWGSVKLLDGAKSLQGTAAFFVAALVCGFLVGRFSYRMGPAVVAAGALTAAVVEAIPLRINDNLSIPLISGAVMQAMAGAGMG